MTMAVDWDVKNQTKQTKYGQVHFRLDFFIEANNMDPDQTVWVPILFAI